MDKRIYSRMVKASALGFKCEVINDESLLTSKDEQSTLYYISNNEVKYIEYNNVELIPIKETKYIKITNIRYKKSIKTYESLIDFKGNIIINATNDKIRHIIGDIFSIQINNLQGVINVKTNKSTPVCYQKIELNNDIKGSCIKVYKELTYFYLDESLNEIKV